MNELKNYILPLFLFALLLFINSCSTENSRKENPEKSGELHVSSASSLRFALEEIGQAFEVENNVKVIFQFGSSGNLAQQISSGAPIDIFISANKTSIDELVGGGYILEESVNNFTEGRIVLALNKKADLKVRSLEDLSDSTITHIAIANPSHAPYGLAAKEALVSMGLWDKLEYKLVYGETVLQTMQYVQTGDAPVGIIALSNADVPDIDYYLIDDSLHKPIIHMLGIVTRSGQQELASDFIAFISSSGGKEIMESYGFYQPEPVR